MVRLCFVDASGGEREVNAQVGQSVMEAALGGGVADILADCGGSLSCATCHVHVAREWLDRVGTASDDEKVMLEMAIDPDETSRLSCQIIITDELDGLALNLPASQI
ncbi:Ferredoxin-6 (plasmid) [Sphingobium sp. AntQ-1]|nr:Ferredoxin-6 [Sphingobium sp. AntQ-1]